MSTELFPRLGLAEQLAPKSRRIVSERVAAVVARGEVEIGFQQVSEILSIEGAAYAGPLPNEYQRVTTFSTGIATDAENPDGAQKLIDFLSSDAAAPDDRRNRSRAVGAAALTRADRGEPMATYTRKEFLGLSAVLAGGAGLARLPVAAAQEPAGAAGPADLAVINARVYTVDDALPRAQAFAVRGDRFTAVGSTDDVRNLVDPGTEVIDAEGMTVTPGFIDTHSHPSGVNELYGVNTNLRTVAEIQAALRTKALDTPPGRWVRGFMFDDTKVVDGPLRIPLDLQQAMHQATPPRAGLAAAALSPIAARTPRSTKSSGAKAGAPCTKFSNRLADSPLTSAATWK